jgi:hypothetical protein
LIVAKSSSEVKGSRRREDCSAERVGRVTEERKVEQSTEEKGGAAHKVVKY